MCILNEDIGGIKIGFVPQNLSLSKIRRINNKRETYMAEYVRDINTKL